MIALLDESSNMSSRILAPDEKVLPVKSTCSPSCLLVLCSSALGLSVENLSNSIKQNVKIEIEEKI